jgi:hypothetical protein
MLKVNTTQLMRKIATTYQTATATYRHLAHQQGRDTVRYHQHAARPNQLAGQGVDPSEQTPERRPSHGSFGSALYRPVDPDDRGLRVFLG